MVATKIVKCWTDSITAFYWILGEEKEWKLFVENRVQEIRKLVAPSIWAHCPGKDNPADISTRKYDASKLQENLVWWHGPQWLNESSLNWPKDIRSQQVPEDCLRDMKLSTRVTEKETTTLLNQGKVQVNLSSIIPHEKFSNYERLLRHTAYVYRFINNCRRKSDRSELLLETSELANAEESWIREMQRSFPKPQLSHLEHQLGKIVAENEIIRCKGHMAN